MLKSRILLFIFVITASVLIYMLPRYVVSSVSTATSEANEIDSHEHDIGGHQFTIPDSIAGQLKSLYELFEKTVNQEKRIIFADSLAKAYKLVGKLDSSAKYTEYKAGINPTNENILDAGDSYYEAFNYEIDQQKRQQFADKARDYYSRVLNENPELFDVKSKMAMTMTIGSNPMQGIMMLREIIDQDPNNELANYNLGILAISTGQYDRAIERFERLKQINDKSPEANFYLGYCFFELGEEQKAKPYFENVLSLDSQSDLAQASKEYLNRIGN